MEICYLHHVFSFEPQPGESLAGRLSLNEVERTLLAGLVAAEDESAFLDDQGERLPPNLLFAQSPWSCSGPDGAPVKLLCRSLDLQDGSARFEKLESYPGDLFRWLRGGRASDS